MMHVILSKYLTFFLFTYKKKRIAESFQNLFIFDFIVRILKHKKKRKNCGAIFISLFANSAEIPL